MSAPNIYKIILPRNRSNVKVFNTRKPSAQEPCGIHLNVPAEEADDQ